jgi:hypothetical protein
MADEMPLSDDARQAGFGFASYLLVLSLIDRLVQTNRLSRQGARPHTPDIGPEPDWDEFVPDAHAVGLRADPTYAHGRRADRHSDH